MHPARTSFYLPVAFFLTAAIFLTISLLTEYLGIPAVLLILPLPVLSCLFGFVWKPTVFSVGSANEAHLAPLFANLVAAALMIGLVLYARTRFDLGVAYHIIVPVIVVPSAVPADDGDDLRDADRTTAPYARDGASSAPTSTPSDSSTSASCLVEPMRSMNSRCECTPHFV